MLNIWVINNIRFDLPDNHIHYQHHFGHESSFRIDSGKMYAFRTTIYVFRTKNYVFRTKIMYSVHRNYVFRTKLCIPYREIMYSAKIMYSGRVPANFFVFRQLVLYSGRTGTNKTKLV